MNLDAIIAENDVRREPRGPNATIEHVGNGVYVTTLDDTAPVTITHETAATTFLALAEYYDNRRDAAVEGAAKIIAAYGQEVQKRGNGMTAAVAAPLLAEMRRYLDAADAAQHKAERNRALHIDAR